MTAHAWTKTVLAPARFDKGRAAVRWWPHCATCGSQVAIVGRTVYYRASSQSEWTETHPACAPPSRSTDEP